MFVAPETRGQWQTSECGSRRGAGGRNAQIQFGHDTAPVGSVVVVAARDRWWMADCVVESDDPKVLARIRVGAPVSVGFDPIHSDDNLAIRVRRHDLAQLRHMAILRRGEIPAYADAKITSVTEAKLTTASRTTVAVGDATTVDGEEIVHARGQLLVRHNIGQILGVR
jgi:hypothetical protein